MSSVEKEMASPAVIELLGLRDQLRNIPSPEFSWLVSLETELEQETQIRLLLLRAALDHGLGLSSLNHLMNALWNELGEALWELPPLKQRELETLFCAIQWFDRWMLKEQAAGIVWSVGKFIRKQRSLERWINAPLAQLLDEAAKEIFWFGAHSVERLKGRRFLSSLHLPSPWGAGVRRDAEEWNFWRFPVWRGSMRFWSQHRSEITSAKKPFSRVEVAEELSRFFCTIDRENPLELSYAARYFRETNE